MAETASLFDDTENPFFPATRAHAQMRIEAFKPSMGSTYASKRNYDLGPGQHDYVSQLSPFIRHRLITEQEVAQAALSRFAFSTAEKFVQEVYWRTYFKGWLERHPSVWRRYVSARDEALSDLSGGRKTAYEKAIGGKSGIEPFDFWVRELIDTGYLHNHARMWFASIWVFTLDLPWVLGADFFHRHLLDGDAASNTLSWRWVAGLHTKGKNYAARSSNIKKYTDDRFGNIHGLAQDPAPLEDEWNGAADDAPSILPQSLSGDTLLLLHEDDLGVESLPLGDASIVAAAVYADPAARSKGEVGELVHQFTDEAVDDTCARLKDARGVEAKAVAAIDQIIAAAKDSGASQIVMPYVPSGPASDALSGLKREAEDAGLSLHVVQRSHDRDAWPHCAKGFFGLKKKIPDLIEPGA